MNTAKQKRALAVHDISCVGRCSLTVALPVISAAGIDCSVLPTAVLSTHTGGFSGFTFKDLTDQLIPIMEHWKSLGIHFDSIYTGYLGSIEQVDLVMSIIDELKSDDTLVVVDPVMADDGKLYASFPKEFPAAMARLCSKADVMIPNITEACLMTGYEYSAVPQTKDYIDGLLAALSKLGAKRTVLTGVSFDEAQLGAAVPQKNGDAFYCFEGRIDGYFHGTGDVFGSALVAALMRGFSLERATEVAVKYTRACIKKTDEMGLERRYGVCFELLTPELLKLLEI